MARKKNAIEPMPAYHLNPDIHFIDLYIKKELIRPGALLRVKNDKKIYIFERMCTNVRLNTTWIDLRSLSDGDWLSIRPERLKGLHIAKKSRVKK